MEDFTKLAARTEFWKPDRKDATEEGQEAMHKTQVPGPTHIQCKEIHVNTRHDSETVSHIQEGKETKSVRREIDFLFWVVKYVK